MQYLESKFSVASTISSYTFFPSWLNSVKKNRACVSLGSSRFLVIFWQIKRTTAMINNRNRVPDIDITTKNTTPWTFSVGMGQGFKLELLPHKALLFSKEASMKALMLGRGTSN